MKQKVAKSVLAFVVICLLLVVVWRDEIHQELQPENQLEKELHVKPEDVKQDEVNPKVEPKDELKEEPETVLPEVQSKPDDMPIEEEKVEAMSMDDIKVLKAGTVLDLSKFDAVFTASLFYAEEIQDEVFLRISGVSYQENESISRADLRYLRVLHKDLNGQTMIGELIVHAAIAQDVLSIMKELYDNNYPIEKMVLIDEYGADDNLSMEDNNSSAFNYRKIAGSTSMSKHSLGLAIDINPLYNPYVRTGDNGEAVIEPAKGAAYADRSQEFLYKIQSGDLCYQLFSNYGFSWGGDWNSVKDYQHFEKNID